VNWLVFAILSWVALGLEQGFRPALQVGSVNIAPSFVLILLVFISLWVRASSVIPAALILGACLDMLNKVPTETGESVVILGPWALGGALGAFLILNLRAMVFRRNPLTLAVLCFIAAFAAQVVVLAILMFRASYDSVSLQPAATELTQRLLTALYTGLVSILIGPLLQMAAPWIGVRKRTHVASVGPYA